MLTQSRKDAKTEQRDAEYCLSSPRCVFAALRETLFLMLGAWSLCFLASSDANAQEKPSRASGDKAIEARRILKTYCIECHGKNPSSQPANSQLSILEHSRLTAKTDASHPFQFVKPKDAKNSHLLELIECGSMPPGGRKRPEPAEIAKLRDWIESSAPAYPAEFDDRYVLEQILADYESHPQDAEHYRYVSYAHLIVNDRPPPMFGQIQRELNVAIQLSARVPGIYREVDECATIIRYDLRETGFLLPDQFKIVIDGKGGGVVPFTPYDMALLEYPFGFTLPDNDPQAARLKQFLDASRLARRHAFVRGDWLAHSLAQWPAPMQPDRRPLGQEIKDIIDLGTLPKAMEPRRPSESELFKGAKPVVVKPTPEGWNPIPPLSAVYSTDVSTAPEPFTLEAEVVNSSLKPISQIGSGVPFSIRLKSNKGVFFTVIHVMSDGEIRMLPVAGNTQLIAEKDKMLGPKDSGQARFKLDVPEGKEEVTEYFIILACTEDVPLSKLQFIRSKHQDSQIFRFLFDPSDPTKVVRKVLPLKVTAK